MVIYNFNFSGKKEVSKWQEVIFKFNLTWIQYLDTGGVETEKQIYFYGYPTNFLLDTNGKILKKNISPADLALYLRKNLQ